jgi:ABC-type sugar transport system ATPase subunit
VSSIARERTTGTVLAAEGISRRYGHTLALDGVGLALRTGEVHGIAGHNGAGKSTLLRILSGAEQPDSGRITLDASPLQLAGPASALAAGISCVYQELSLAPNMTVAQNIFLGTESNRAGRVKDREMNAETAELLEEFGVPVRPTDAVSRLPVAQRQMVEILRALHRRTAFLLLDEPTTALQPHQIELLIAALRRIVAERHVAVALIDHKLDELYAVADRITVLTDGRVTLSGAVADTPRERLIDAIVGTGNRRARDVLLASAAGTAAPAPAAEADAGETAPRDTVLGLAGVETDRLRDLDLEVRGGQVHGIYGLVGSGRTRLLRTIVGLEPIKAGRLTLLGEPYRPTGPREAIRRGIAYVSEERKADGFIPGTDAYDNAVLPVLSRYARFGVIRRSAARQAAREILDSLDIRGEVSGPIERLSGGNQQKALLGKALMQKPRVLLLDEPTKGIDIAAKAEIHGIIRDLAHRDGVAVIVVSSEEEEILAVSDRVAVMRGGRIVGPPSPAGEYSILELRRQALGQQEPSKTA